MACNAQCMHSGPLQASYCQAGQAGQAGKAAGGKVNVLPVTAAICSLLQQLSVARCSS